VATSSARPENLERFCGGSRAADDDLLTSAAALVSAYNAFQSACQWGALDAGSLLNGLNPQFLGFNEEDARWVHVIAENFRRAGGHGGIASLPDAAIAASLRQAGLGDTRGSVTFDDPVAYGFPPTSGYADDPVNTATGNFVELETDVAFGGLLAGLRFARTYNSRSDRAGAFGLGWSSWANARLNARPEGAEYEGPDGQRALFGRMGAGYDRVVGVHALVEPLDDGGLALAWFGGRRWEFDDAGLPALVTNGPGTEVRLTHDERQRLVELVHRGGKRIDLTWDGERIVAAACSDGRRVSYSYDGVGNLVQADRSGAVRRYGVDDGGRIVTVTDADGVVEVANEYDDEGRVVAQRSPFGRRSRYAYLPGRVTVTDDDSDGPANTYVHDTAGRVLAIIDGAGEQMSFNYDQWGNPVVITERGGAATVHEFDARARVVRRVLPTGAEWTYSYDDADRVVEVTATGGATTVLRYAGDERSPVEIVDPEGGVSRMTVAGGLVREVVDPDGVTVGFEFDADGNIVETIDADGNVARLERDAAGRVTAAITPLGRRTTFSYDDRGLLAERRDPAGGVWRYEHTAAGRLSSVTDPTSAREQTRYGEHGAPEVTVDPLGRTTEQHHDQFGNVVALLAPDGAQWRYGYDALMRLTTTDDPSGVTWRREYDADGNLVASIDPIGTRCSATIDPAGRITNLSDGLTSTAYEFDAFGRAVAQVRPDATETRCEYDRCGRRMWIQDPVGGVTRIEYSPAGRAIGETSPSGRVERVEYDRCGRLAARIDGAGRRWEYRYDGDGAVVARIEPDGGTAHFEYDAAGRLAASWEPGQGSARYEYDAAGRTTLVDDRDGGTRRFGYDPGGRMVSATDANGGVTQYAYDAGGRLIETVDPLGGMTRRRYDVAGRLVAETDPLGRTATIDYDAAGRVVARADGSGRMTHWTHDASGRVSSFGAAGSEPITIERDLLGREISIAEPGSYVNELRWDRAGRLVERRRDGDAVRWRYTPDGERAALGHPDGSETTFTYDAGGLLVGKQHPGVGAIELERDGAGRLVGAAAHGMRALWRHDGGDLSEYRFEAAGELRTAQITRDGVGRVIEALIDGTAQRFAYDAAGGLLSAQTPAGAFSFTYDANGRLTCERSRGATVDYGYDAAGQLLSRRGDGDGGATKFEYDGAGRRVRQSSSDVERAWSWDDLGRLTQVDTAAGDGSPLRATNVSVDALGELALVDGVAVMWDSAHELAPLAWLGDSAVVGHGTPWALAGDGEARWLAPDWQGTVGEAPRDPWGAALDVAGVARLALGYRGELELGSETWLRNRVYQPEMRSFLLPDPRPPVPGTAVAGNPYHFAGDDPVGHSDPLGLRPISDAELAKYRDRMDRNIFERGGDFIEENADYIAAGALIVAGGVLIATGVGGPIGIGLISTGVSAGLQRLTTGEVNWVMAGVDGTLGMVTGGSSTAARGGLRGAASLADDLVPEQAAVNLLGRGGTRAVGGRLGPVTSSPGGRADFIAGPNGVIVPTSRARLEGGFRAAGFPEAPTPRAPGTEYTLPDGSLVRVMEPTSQAPLRASFTNRNGGPTDPFTGKPPPRQERLSPAENRTYSRDRTHVELHP
jgi:RHS repeat-associated protein